MQAERKKDAEGFGAILLTALLTALFVVTFLRTAWLSDDAYITFRTVDNFLNGYGLRWNIDERVQVYTHPLWMFLMTIPYAVTREMFLTPIFTAMAVSTLAVALLLFAVARARVVAVLAGIILICSRAFIDYSSSGLENPLTHVLIAVFLLVFFRVQWSMKTLATLSFIAGLAALNRLDSILLFAPALLYAWLSERSLRAMFAMGLGFLPLITWEIFSLVYYGFPFPNTAYAKLGTGIPENELFQQGLYYFANSWSRDPITLIGITLGLLVAIVRREGKLLVLAAGVALYMFYIAKIGGDFMAGRFLTPPLFLAMGLLVQLPAAERIAPWTLAYAAALFIGLSTPFAPFLTGRDYGRNMTERIAWKDEHGIGDERRFYFQEAGLLHYQRGKQMPTHQYVQEGLRYAKTKDDGAHAHGSVGYRGFFGGPTVHIVDYYALADPLLARMPARYAPNWRIGHFAREVPPGYLDTAETNEVKIRDPKLAEYYERLRLVVSGPIWSGARWREIVNMNLGKYDGFVDWDTYRYPDMKRASLEELATVKPAGYKWDGEGTLALQKDGLRIDFGGLRHNGIVEISADNNDDYRFVFLREGEVVGEVTANPPSVKSGLSLARVAPPNDAIHQGYDAIHILPSGGDERYSIGHLRFL